MNESRTYNAVRNIIFGMILKFYQLIVPFLIRTAIIYRFGMAYAGLNGFFVSIVQVINLAELGIGTAIVQSMYRPIVERDEKKLCALLNLIKHYYYWICIFIFFIGVIISFFLPYLIKDVLPLGINIYVIYYINLFSTICSYGFWGYKGCILQSNQRSDISSKISIFTYTFMYALQFVSIFLIKNYYCFVVCLLINQIVTNIFIAIVTKKVFPQYKAEGKIGLQDESIIRQNVKGLFLARIGGTIVNSADTIVISAMLGITTLAIYQNYYYVINAASGIMSVVFSSITAGIGKGFVTETKEKNYIDLKRFTFAICFILCIFCALFVGVLQAFIDFWVGKKNMLGDEFVLLFSLMFYVLQLIYLWTTIKDAAGIWYKDRYRPFVSSIINLVLNLIMVRYWGLYGIILSTILSFLFVSIPWVIHNMFSLIFKIESKEYVKELLVYLLVLCLCMNFIRFTCCYIEISGWVGLIIKSVFCIISAVLIQLLVYRKSQYVDYYKKKICNSLKGGLH